MFIRIRKTINHHAFAKPIVTLLKVEARNRRDAVEKMGLSLDHKATLLRFGFVTWQTGLATKCRLEFIPNHVEP